MSRRHHKTPVTDSLTPTRRTLACVRGCALAASLVLLPVTFAVAQGTQPNQPRQTNETPQQPATRTAPQQQQQPTNQPPSQNDSLGLPPPPPPPPRRQPAPQQQQSEDSKQAADQQGQEVDEGEVLNVEARQVNLQVRVVDRQNRPINNVRESDLRVFEDGVPQEITFFTREEVPISYGLAIDTSYSLRSQIDKVIDASKTIVESNKPEDETFLIEFRSSDQIELLQDFTPDKSKLTEQLDELYVNAGQTAVIDAVYLAAQHAATRGTKDERDVRRRALILITDGEDRNSQYEQEELLRYLREQGVQIYVIGFVNELDAEGGFIKKSPRERAVNLLNRVAKETGGRAFFPESVSELSGIAEEITRDLRTQYVVGYSPKNKARNGAFRSVRVAVADGPSNERRIALTRSGYTAPNGDDAITAPAARKTLRPTK